MSFLSRFNRFSEKIVGSGLAFLLLGITIILCINVITRYGFGYSLFWAEELTNYIIIWITLLGSSLCIRYGMHMSVDVLLQSIKNSLWKTIILFIEVMISLIFVVAITVIGGMQVISVMNSGQISPALMIPMYIPYLALPLGGLLMVFQYVELLLIHISNINIDSNPTKIKTDRFD